MNALINYLKGQRRVRIFPRMIFLLRWVEEEVYRSRPRTRTKILRYFDTISRIVLRKCFESASLNLQIFVSHAGDCIDAFHSVLVSGIWTAAIRRSFFPAAVYENVRNTENEPLWKNTMLSLGKWCHIISKDTVLSKIVPNYQQRCSFTTL